MFDTIKKGYRTKNVVSITQRKTWTQEKHDKRREQTRELTVLRPSESTLCCVCVVSYLSHASYHVTSYHIASKHIRSHHDTSQNIMSHCTQAILHHAIHVPPCRVVLSRVALSASTTPRLPTHMNAPPKPVDFVNLRLTTCSTCPSMQQIVSSVCLLCVGSLKFRYDAEAINQNDWAQI